MAYDPTSTEGVPEAGRARLQQNRAGLFTSDLSINEFLLVRQAGFQPLGLVIGSSIYHIGIQLASYRQNQELTVLSQAMYEARELAMTRMEEEAEQLGADGDELGQVLAPLVAADVEPHPDHAVGAELLRLLLHARHRQLPGLIHRL